MSDKFLNISEFKLEGEFLGFAGASPDKCKSLRLKIASSEIKILLPRDLRMSVGLWLSPGYKIGVCGVTQLNLQTSKLKLKAYNITLIYRVFNKENLVKQALPTKPKILVCQGSSCREKGGQGFLSKLEQNLCVRGLQGKVTVERSGCLRNCGKGPFCVVKMGKNKYSRVNPDASSLAEEFGTHTI